jgi:hypothetical protein
LTAIKTTTKPSIEIKEDANWGGLTPLSLASSGRRLIPKAAERMPRRAGAIQDGGSLDP